ncbi:hypothetical protein FQA47_021957 [Oryzias melastigma]|uniref:Uncharacterized protein n=1 Tax=Oryzias melastigma TaxID=30732 RepID=A0A834C3C8_ORYME|nr:hypothetical protein FQA47_021957 [Oryzias melastigma]
MSSVMLELQEKSNCPTDYILVILGQRLYAAKVCHPDYGCSPMPECVSVSSIFHPSASSPPIPTLLVCPPPGSQMARSDSQCSRVDCTTAVVLLCVDALQVSKVIHE